MKKRRQIWFDARDEILDHPYVQRLSIEARSALVQDVRTMTLSKLQAKLKYIESIYTTQAARVEASTEL